MMMDWRPDPGITAGDLEQLRNKVVLACRWLLRQSEDPVAVGTLGALDQLALESSPALTHPDMFAWYHRLRRSVEQPGDMLPPLEETLSSISGSVDRAAQTEPRLGLPIDLDNEDPAVAESLERAGRYVQGKMDAPVALSAVPMTDTIVDALRDAFAVLERIWPEFVAELRVSIQRLAVFSGPAAIGYADFRYHGTVFLKSDYIAGSGRTATSLAEEIVHEASHVRLTTTIAATPLFTNDDQEIYQSPLRRDSRSMMGVFQQMFVLARLAEFHERRLAEANSVERRSLRANRERIQTNLADAMATVQAHARLTPGGRDLMTHIVHDYGATASTTAV